MKFQPPKGTRDFMPQEMILRQKVFDTLRRVFERFGFDPMDTPAFESADLLNAKGGGGEAVKEEIYYFRDKSERLLGLRFDLTVPTARVVAGRPELSKPFKRYQMGPVWRYEEIKSGRRYREFWQCDADIFGVPGMEADAEALAVASEGLKALGFRNFVIRLNSRKVLEGMAEAAGVPEGKWTDAFRALDKIEKFGIRTVEKEMAAAGLTPVQTSRFLKFTRLSGTNTSILKEAKGMLKNTVSGVLGTEELKELTALATRLGVKNIKIDLSLARGLDYYTGPVFEGVIKGGEGAGSVLGGGRYDRLIELYGGRPTPATGISFGVERIAGILKGNGKLQKTTTQLLVIPVNEKVRPDCLEIAGKLRKAGVNTETDMLGRNISKQMSYANSLGIPYVLVVGERELKTKTFALKDMKSGKTKKTGLEGIGKIICG